MPECILSQDYIIENEINLSCLFFKENNCHCKTCTTHQ